MGSYVYGIVISVVMIAAGLSGQFSGSGSGINIPLVAFGAFFLIIDVMMLLRARQASQQATQADEARTASAGENQVEAGVEIVPSDQQQEAMLEVTPEASVEEPIEVLAETTAETAPEVPAETIAPIEESASAEG